MSRTKQPQPPRVWQRMLSGRRLDLLDPSPLDIEISDIAHGLARVARWNGQTRGDCAFSVAQHSLIVEQIVAGHEPDPRWRLAALLHDAPEYVIGDMISPFKTVLGGDYKSVEKRLQAAVHLRYGLPASLPAPVVKAIKAADQVSAYFEATLLAGFETREAAKLFGAPGTAVCDAADFAPRPAAEVGQAFLDRFAELDAVLAAPRPAEPKTPRLASAGRKR
ncbi:HD family hydrolase [Aurantimonas sp. VKM B-3413]|uniref:HD family hydrolase n=1 Tax=Aurantimonas sp. VKM B-3413 TaxID=2779401 RepID=UPI001E3E4BD3|nr:HD family hydrolase [Aurantimonas sp. VKM B-3413]MCB8836040.1 HD family hydrolase [Aurantimonas sp. VKM B-3413]